MEAKTKQVSGGQVWRQSKVSVLGWDSENGDFRVIPTKDGRQQLLIAFEHEDVYGNFITKRFQTVEAAMEYAEKM